MKHTWKKAAAGLLAVALVVGAALANVGTGGLFGGTSITAYADETETLLTTITAVGASNAPTATSANVSYSTEDIATLTFSGVVHYQSSPAWGWWGYGLTATVTPVEGYTITKCVFYDNANRSATDSEAPFEVKTTEADKTPQVNGTPILANQSNGITKIEVYGYATPAGDTTSDYTLTIPATLAVANSGWNATDGISATGTLATGKKLVVTATSDDEFALVSGENKVNYKLAESGDNTTTYDTATEKTSWEFTALSETAATQPMGIVVEDYSTKPAGDYSDTVTFTAKVEVVKTAAETPDIAQADCTFSPSNGTSTLTNANITTAMEYSADNGTTWTDVTSTGSIASLAAGTVQIRVKETDDKLASEAVSITVPQVLQINELVGPYTGDKLTCEYYAGETWQALVNRYDLIKAYSNRAAFGSDGFIYYKGSMVPVTDLVDNTKTYEVQ